MFRPRRLHHLAPRKWLDPAAGDNDVNDDYADDRHNDDDDCTATERGEVGQRVRAGEDSVLVQLC